jgi:hypothetical protein
VPTACQGGRGLATKDLEGCAGQLPGVSAAAAAAAAATVTESPSANWGQIIPDYLFYPSIIGHYWQIFAIIASIFLRKVY